MQCLQPRRFSALVTVLAAPLFLGSVILGMVVLGSLASCGGNSKSGAQYPSAAPAADVEAMSSEPAVDDDPIARINHYERNIQRLQAAAGLPSGTAAHRVTNDAHESMGSDDHAEETSGERVHDRAPPREQPPSCSDICKISEAICENSENICEIAAELSGDNWADERCEASVESCQNARDRCDACSP